MRMLGFIIGRLCYDFKNIRLKTLHCSLARPNLEYGSIVWNPSQLCRINRRLNKVQSYFLRYVSFTFAMNYSTKEIALQLQLRSLPTRRKFNDGAFVFKVLNNYIQCPVILEEIGWLTPTYLTRSRVTFYEPFHARSYIVIMNL